LNVSKASTKNDHIKILYAVKNKVAHN
jgi:hypothetical protein